MADEKQASRRPSSTAESFAAAAYDASAKPTGASSPRTRELHAYRCRTSRRGTNAGPEHDERRRSARRRSGYHSVVLLGTGPRGHRLIYNREQYAFTLGGRDVPLAEVRMLDASGLIKWSYMEQRDWMRHLDEPKIAELHSAYLASHLDGNSKSAADAYIADHVRKDNSYLHGHIVEEPPESEKKKPEDNGAKAEASDSEEGQSNKQAGAEKGKSKGHKGLISGKIDKLLSGDPEKEPTIGELAEREKAEQEESEKKRRRWKPGKKADRKSRDATGVDGVPPENAPR